MNKLNLRKFLNSSVVDPNDRKDALLRQIIEVGNPSLFEFKVMECVQEAGRLRTRMEASTKDSETLLELYTEKLRLAATYLSLANEMQCGKTTSS